MDALTWVWLCYYAELNILSTFCRLEFFFWNFIFGFAIIFAFNGIVIYIQPGFGFSNQSEFYKNRKKFVYQFFFVVFAGLNAFNFILYVFLYWTFIHAHTHAHIAHDIRIKLTVRTTWISFTWIVVRERNISSVEVMLQTY